MSTIEIKPEAPWIKRSEEGVIFTDDVVGVEVQLSQSSSSSEESEPEQDEDEEDLDDHQQYSNQDEDESDRQNPATMDRAELKNFFKLDPTVEAKLAKLR